MRTQSFASVPRNEMRNFYYMGKVRVAETECIGCCLSGNNPEPISVLASDRAGLHYFPTIMAF